MKVIFLDIDGVLNSDEYYEKTRNLDIQGIESEIDVSKIELLKKAIDITEAKVVLTSSWRYTKNALLLKDLLRKYKINVDSTPYIDNKRGLEIKKWLLDNPNVEDYVIIDDEVFSSYDEELMSKLIKISNTNGHNFGPGLLPKDIDKIIDKLDNKKKVKIMM